MPHQFQLGQLVRRMGQIGAPARIQIYEIVSQLPEEKGMPRYRIKGTEPGTLVVSERELVAASRPLATSTRTATARTGASSAAEDGFFSLA